MSKNQFKVKPASDAIIEKQVYNNEINDLAYISPPNNNTLSYYIYHNKIDILKKYLSDKKIDPNQRDGDGITASWTPLYWAVKMDKIECVHILLEMGADINLIVNDVNECCGTVLDLAVLRNNEVMEEILRKYADNEDINFGQSFKAIRTKLRGKSPSFNFKNYKKTNNNEKR